MKELKEELRVVFLDFDGVINKNNEHGASNGVNDIDEQYVNINTGWFSGNKFPYSVEAMNIINKIGQIYQPIWVLSTSWRLIEGLWGCKRILSYAGMRPEYLVRMNDITPRLSGPRANEISSYIKDKNWKNRARILILDDSKDAFVGECSQYGSPIFPFGLSQKDWPMIQNKLE